MKPIQILLYVLSIFYLIGAIAHYFGLTIFPWYDSALYSPYHDSIIAMAAIGLAIILFTLARNPVQEIVTGVSVAAAIGGILTLIMVYSVELTNTKYVQAIVEGISLLIVSVVLYVLNARDTADS